jgi:hypothetical protein
MDRVAGAFPGAVSSSVWHYIAPFIAQQVAPGRQKRRIPMKQKSFRAQSLFFLLLFWIPALWGQPQAGNWRLVGTGDCPGRDVGGSTGSVPVDVRCDASFYGYTAVCWSGNCTYKNVPTGSCTGGANPGRMYTCDAAASPRSNAATGPLTARIEPADSEVEFGGKVRLHAFVSGGVPPYTYEWRNGDQLSNVATNNINFSDLNRLGDRDIVLTARDAAGSAVETHAAIHVQAAQANAPIASPQPSGAVVNLALHKPATQSSVYRGTGIDQGPQFGDDGILDSQPRDPYLVVITDPNDSNPPWWQVDLQGVYTLTQLKLYNRKACCQDRAKTVQVLLSTDGTNWGRAYAHNGTTFDVLTVDLTGRKARYVKLQLTERTSLNFQECEVYGYANAPPTQTIASQPSTPAPPINKSPQPAASSPQPSGPSLLSYTVDIAGTWQPGARGETWTFKALGDGAYEAVGRGSSSSTGIVTVIGNRVRLDYKWQDGGEHTGYYQLTVDSSGRRATGSFQDDRGQQGAVSMTRTAGP